MSRGKLRSAAELCADCGAPDPTWASVNRGILLCDECCSIHRSLGRHISQVKSLRRGAWSPAQLAMVHALYSSGANSIWEHTLLDPSHAKSGRRKPSPKEPLHPTKAEFIRAKHQNLAFVHRPSKEENPSLEADLNKQLHSSVRTGNLETSLRLLAYGSDPNYIHPDKRNTPLHMAAKTGQSSQVELLVVYGADPAARDSDDRAPSDYAREAGHHDLADRLIECQYELGDRLAFYLCGRKPDHQSGQHFIIPEMADSIDMSELAKEAKKKLQELPNQLFEELAMDVYDEVDRRENDAIWLSTQNHSALVMDRQTVPFLPVSTEFSSTRNQGRQKLARFNAREFATLIIDILSELKRRQVGLTIPFLPKDRGLEPKTMEHTGVAEKERALVRDGPNLSDDEPLYDSVASDDDNTENQRASDTEQDRMDVASSGGSGGGEPAACVEKSDGPIPLQDYLCVKKQLATSEGTVHQLLHSNKDMKQEISVLQNMVHKLMQENSHLRSFVQYDGHSYHQTPNGYEGHGSSPRRHLVLSAYPGPTDEGAGPVSCALRSPRSSGQRPQSMYEPRERQQQLHHQHPPQPCSPPWPRGSTYGQPYSHVYSRTLPRDDSGIAQSHSSHSSRHSGDYDNASGPVSCSSSCRPSRSSSRSPPCESVEPTPGLGLLPPLDPVGSTLVPGDATLPSQGEVFSKTEQITKRIQELLISAQEGKHESFLQRSEKIYRAVIEMASIFPQGLQEETIQLSLKQLTGSALRLQAECKSLLGQQQPPADHRFVTQQVMQCAYDIAKAAKQLVTLFQ